MMRPITALPASATPRLTPTAVPTPTGIGALFSKISHSTNVLHLQCDPLEIIFDVTARDSQVKGALFYYRLENKTNGIISEWSNAEMRPAGNNIFEFIFRSKTIPEEARYQQAWIQYQFVGLNQAGESLGNTQIFVHEINYQPDCP